MTSSSWMTSNEPETTKQSVSTLSPMWKMRSPGAQCVVWNSTARERRQPSLARRKAGWSLNTCLFRCTQMSALMSLGQMDRTCGGQFTVSQPHNTKPTCQNERHVKKIEHLNVFLCCNTIKKYFYFQVLIYLRDLSLLITVMINRDWSTATLWMSRWKKKTCKS